MISSLIIHLVIYLVALLYLIIAHMVLVKRGKEVLCHNALVTTHFCYVMVFIFSVDVTFSWLVSTPVLR
jgi:hypothetical protein